MSSVNIPNWETIVSFFNSSKESLRYHSPFLHYKLTHIKPWSQFFNFRNLSAPKNFQELKARASNNLNYFSSNYIVIGLLVTLITIFFNWSLFLTLAVLLAGLVILQRFHEIHIFGRDFSVKNVRLVLILISIPFFIWFDVIHSLLEIIGYSLAVIALHSGVLDGYTTETSFNESLV